jgi:uncharacterized protein YdeI (YjbR/CyaY-like superfamily)
MKSVKTVDEYILNAKYGKDILLVLRDIIRKTGLTETIKWGSPVYTFQGKNIVGIGSFKSYSGLWFFQGALLKDKAEVLINAQEEVTKAQRQWRFTSVEEIDEKLVLDYILEAIENQKKGKEIKADRNKPLVIPDELQDAFSQNPQLKAAFCQFTPGHQREFADYVSEAKRTETRINRVQKIIPMILGKQGLNDKYRK